ncbi:MAG: ABC transporter substrate-binding protein [Oscillospiraceae bacterium]
MKKRVIALLLVLALALSFAACGPKTEETTGEAPAPQGETFKLGAYLQLTGGNSAYGNEAWNGVKLDFKYINENGGMNGMPIETVVYDTQGSPEEAVKVVTKMIQNDNINACIGSINSGDVLAAAPYLNKAGIYNIGLGTAASWMKEDWPFVFRPTMNNDTATPLCADLLAELDYKTVGVINGMDDASFGTANSFQAMCEERKIEVVAREQFEATDTDYSAQIAKILAAEPDCVYIAVIGDVGGPMIKQLRQNGYKGIIFDKESFMASQIEIAGAEASNYIAFANPYVTYKTVEECDIPIVKEYLQRYQDEYGKMVETDSAYRGWDGMMVIWEAGKIAGSNESDALREATHKVVIDGLGGKLDFTKGNREGYNEFNKFILVDGKNILWSKWVEGGGYDAFKTATGRDK